MLDRLRAPAPHDPLLIVPTAADVEHYQRELAASGFVFGAQVLTFRNLIREIGAGPACARGRSGRSARDRVVRAAVAGVPLQALAGSAAMPGFARAAGDLFAELQRSLVTPARFTSALRAWAGAVAHAVRRRARHALLRVPPPAGGARAPRPGGLRLGGARRRAGRPGLVGRPARVLLRLRRPHADGARRGRDARPPLRDRRVHRAPLRARPRRVRGPGRHGRGAPPARRGAAPPARALRALRADGAAGAPPPRAPLFEPGAPAPRAQRRDAAAGGRRRARGGRARRRRGARAHAQGDRAARHRRPVARRRGDDRARRAGAHRLRHPGLLRPPSPVPAHPARRGRAGRARAPRCPTAAPATC